MGGRARLEQAFKLSDFVRELALKNIRVDKTLSKVQAMQELRRRMYPMGETHAR